MTDILSELEKQVGPSGNGSRRTAKEYLRLREELKRCLDANLFLAESEAIEAPDPGSGAEGDDSDRRSGGVVRAESETLKSEYELLGTELDAAGCGDCRGS